MRLLSWLLCAAVTIVPVFTSEERNISRPKRDSSEKKIVCYYTNWSVYRPGTAKFTPQNINPYLCTHLIYAFGGLSKDNALKPFDKYQDIEQGGYAKFNGLKTYNKNLKTMLAIGGWNEGSARFSPLVADAERRKELVKNTVKFLRQNHFDGLDLDWEYPSFRDGGKPRDRDNYATLVQEFREEFERESEKTGRPRLLLTMAVPAGIEYIDKGYDIPKLNKYLDWMNILSYDYHSAFEPAVNHHSPLFSLEEDDEYNFDAALNIDHTIKHYIKLGADKSKLVLGIPTYGRSYTLFNPDATEVGSPADGPGEQGEATREKGYLAYYEICERVSSGGWTQENPNPKAVGPYAHKGNQWVGFDDENIVRIKAKYVNDNDLGGIMFWSIDNDDFRGKCHGKPYPLIEAAKEALLSNANELEPRPGSEASRSSSKKLDQETVLKTKTRKTRLRAQSFSTTEPAQTKATDRTSTTPKPPTTPDPGSDFVCKDEGFFPHPRDCKKYFWCLDSGPSSLGIVAHQFTCPSGLVFNKISDSCDYARNVICKTKSESSTTTSTTTTTTTTAKTTTSRSRSVITAFPPRTTTTTTTTTAEAPDGEEDEEDEEDPGTIKELINLIKKLGGVEQLEKQLNLQNSYGKESIKPSLYSRVLQGRTANRYRGVTAETTTSKYVSAFRNRPVGPQSPSTEETSSGTGGPEKLRYVTIQRNRPTKKPIPVEENDEESYEGEEEEEEEQRQPKQPVQEVPNSFRRRPTTDTSTEKEYVTLRRFRPLKEEVVSTPKYKNLVRVRSTTEMPVENKEEEEPEDDEETVDEKEEAEEIESPQKLKKYSSILRDNKKVLAGEEESKVSDLQGLQHDSAVSSTTTDSVFDVKNNVNNVNIVTSPMYVEIRRTRPTTAEPTRGDVHTVNNLNNSNQENINELNEVYKQQPEGRENNVSGFQRRITTEVVKRPTRPSTLASTTPITAETINTDTKFPRFREKLFSAPETNPTFSNKLNNQFKTESKDIAENEDLFNLNQNNKLLKSNTADKFRSVSEAPRRFQFAPRTKSAILSPKYLEATTETFQITVPNIPASHLTQKSSASSFPSATLEPTTLASTDTTVLSSLKDKSYEEKKLSLSIRHIIPTSTQTSVVTSITESSFTERKKIYVSKKVRLKSGDLRFNAELSTTETPFQGTKFLLKPSLTKINFRINSPKIELTTEAIKRRFKSPKSTTNTATTEEPTNGQKYTFKKNRIFKRVSSTEVPEVTSSTTGRKRFLSQNKVQNVKNGPLEHNNFLKLRFSTSKRKKIFPQNEEEEDLEVQQTAAFFDEDFESNDKYILGGAVRQSSEKDYLETDVIFKTVPTVEEEEEKSSDQTDGELAQSFNKITTKAVSSDAKNSIKSNSFPVSTASSNPRTRGKQSGENPLISRLIDDKNSSQTLKNRESLNYSKFKIRAQQNNTNGSVKDKNSFVTTTGFREPEFIRKPKARKLQLSSLRNKVSGINENTNISQKEDNILTEEFGTKSTSLPVTNSRLVNAENNRNTKTRARKNQFVNEKTISGVDPDSELDKTNSEYIIKNNVFSRFRRINTSKSLTTENDAESFRNRKTLNRQYNEDSNEKELEKVTSLKTKSTEIPITLKTYSSSKTIPEENTTIGITVNSLQITKNGKDLAQREQITKSISTVGTTAGPTFGTKIAPNAGFTSTLTASTDSTATRIGNAIRGTFITVAPKPISPEYEDIRKTNLKPGKIDDTTEALSRTPSRSNSNFVNSNADSTHHKFRSFRTRNRQNFGVLENAQKQSGKNNSASYSGRIVRTRGKIKAIDSVFQATENGPVNETLIESKTKGTIFSKGGRKVFAQKPVLAKPEVAEEENELETSEELPVTTSKAKSDKRVTQEYLNNFRSRGRATTQSTITSDRTERKRTHLDRRRFRGEFRDTTLKPEVQTENYSSTSRASILHRKKSRSSTTTTTEEPYVEQEDSRLEESKSLDETPGIQDLADPAVVAIHNLATVSPGPLASAAVTSLNSYSQTPTSYTVHVTPSDIASLSTPANIVSVTPGSVSRPTSILTLKPYTVPLITRQYVTKQTPSPFRATSTIRETGIPVVTNEHLNLRSEVLIQSRKQEAVSKTKPANSVTSTAAQREIPSKPRRLKPFSKVPKQEVAQTAISSEPPVDYEYYDDDEDPLANIPTSALKVKVHSDGYIECLDRGNFPHPFSCKKFISCAKMENNELLGWEYTCPKHLSFDPVGGICNWSAGLGCQH